MVIGHHIRLHAGNYYASLPYAARGQCSCKMWMWKVAFCTVHVILFYHL